MSLFSLALDEAIRRRGISSRELALRLTERGSPVSASTLRSWRGGLRRPEGTRSRDAVDQLEDLLGLPRGHLVARLGPSRRLGVARCEAYEDLVGRQGPMAEMRRSIGVVEPPVLERVGDIRSVLVSDDPRSWSVVKTIHWRARVDGADRAIDMLHLDNPTSVPPAFVAEAGLSIGRREWDPVSGFGVCELKLREPLELGQSAVTEHRVHVVETVALPNYWMVLERRTAFAALSVNWQGKAPAHVDLHVETEHDAVLQVHRTIGGAAHHTTTNFGPGLFGYQWET